MILFPVNRRASRRKRIMNQSIAPEKEKIESSQNPLFIEIQLSCFDQRITALVVRLFCSFWLDDLVFSLSDFQIFFQSSRILNINKE